ncbi:hypothetical protein CPB84DRAFT_1102015 [Gymnopilus junonius]|uniref:Uncharacterized protein n=1 Tax=Gymnopilus junonius TaxID=109634 RepID=A0A9P5NM84_GYMJU|nr:hypothetical protein CPB84DRAFT_1102015 [Gymnopilus junonius]
MHVSWRGSQPPSRPVNRFVTEPSSSRLGRSDGACVTPFASVSFHRHCSLPGAIPFWFHLRAHLLISPLCRSVDLFDGPWPTDGLVYVLASFGADSNCSFDTTNPQELAVLVLARVIYLLATSFLISALFLWIPYYIYAMMDVDEQENIEMDVDAPDLEKGAPCEQDSSRLPFPKLNSDGTIETQYLAIHSLRRPQLVDLCRQFNIPHSGVNMPNLTKRLEDFSRKDDLWDRSGARRAHLGVDLGLTKPSDCTEEVSKAARDHVQG